MNELRKGLFYFPDKGAGDGEGEKPGDDKEGKKPDETQVKDELTWDAWHKTLPEPVQKLISEHESGLRTALASERDARSTAEKDLRDVAGKLEKGSDAQKKVLELADDVAAGTKKADFYEDAHKAGVTNLKLAFHIADGDDLFDKRGLVDFDKMKEEYPELFGKKQLGDGNAGDGTGGKLPGGEKDMNAAIRRMAGIKQ